MNSNGASQANCGVLLNAAFLLEIKEDNARLLKLRNLLENVLADARFRRRQGRRFIRLLDELRDQLAMHFALEEAYGYLDHAVVEDPNLSNRAADLRSQHRGFYCYLSEIVQHCQDAIRCHGASCFAVPPETAKRFQEFNNQLQEHEEQEKALIHEALCVDTGVGD
jgi:hypothetical protein